MLSLKILFTLLQQVVNTPIYQYHASLQVLILFNNRHLFEMVWKWDEDPGTWDHATLRRGSRDLPQSLTVGSQDPNQSFMVGLQNPFKSVTRDSCNISSLLFLYILDKCKYYIYMENWEMFLIEITFHDILCSELIHHFLENFKICHTRCF